MRERRGSSRGRHWDEPGGSAGGGGAGGSSAGGCFQDIAEAIQAHTSTMDLTGQGAIEGLAYQLARMAEAFERIATVLEHQGVRVTVGED